MSNLKIGIEIETEFEDKSLSPYPYHSNRWFSWLRIENDGSLNNGMEFIIKHSSIKTFLNRTKLVLAIIEAFEGEFSKTTGAHINVSSSNEREIMQLYLSLLYNTNENQKEQWFRGYAKNILSVDSLNKYNSLNIKFRRNNKRIYEIRSVNFYLMDAYEAQNYLERSLKKLKRYSFKINNLIRHLKKAQQTMSSNTYQIIEINNYLFNRISRERYLALNSYKRSYLEYIDYKLYKNALILVNSINDLKDKVLGFVWVFSAILFLRKMKRDCLKYIQQERKELAIENFKALFNKYDSFIEQEQMLENFKALFNEEHILDITNNYNTKKVVIKNV